MAPEIVLTEQQFTKPVEERQKASYGCGVDIYSFGLVLYFMLHGKNPLYLEQIGMPSSLSQYHSFLN